MATVAPVFAGENDKSSAQDSPLAMIDSILAVLGSQKIAVAAFAYAIFVIFIGTLAQTQMDIWQVMPAYFRAVIMWLDLNLIPSVFIGGWQRWEGFTLFGRTYGPEIPLPGGMVVGVTMILNILFAHLRWLLQIKTKTAPLLAGIAVMGVGWLVTALIILNGHNRGGFHAQPPFTWMQFWVALQLLMIASWVIAVFSYVWFGIQPAFKQAQLTMVRVGLLIMFGVFLAAFTVLVWFMLFYLTPNSENLRIVWQLLQGTLAGIVLLGGCWLVYQKRGGVVLLHQGLLLLMFNELFVAKYVSEYNISLVEGQTTNFLRDIRASELALVDRSHSDGDKHFIVPQHLLEKNAKLNEANAKSGKPLESIPDPEGQLPVAVTALQYARNATNRPLAKDEKPIATAGRGLKEGIKQLSAAKGTDNNSRADLGAAYVQFKDKSSGKDLGTFLLAQSIAEDTFSTQEELDPKLEKVVDGDKSYIAALRFKRQYVPFTVHLVEARRDNYVGTATPRNYSSDVVLKDSGSGVDSKVHIKMNDPLRYSGLTLYQSGHNELGGGVDLTTLAVVYNNGFMIPYVALMIITVGMIAHFLQTLVRFLKRRESEDLQKGEVIVAQLAVTAPAGKMTAKERKVTLAKRPTGRQLGMRELLVGQIAGSVIFLIFLGLYGFSGPRVKKNDFDFAAFGQLPVAQEGRVKPLDTVARNALLLMRQREWAYGKDNEKVSATRWLLDVITGTDDADAHRIIKIDDQEIRKLLDLKDTSGHVFSVNDLRPHIEPLQKLVEAAAKTPPEKQTAQQRGILKIAQGMQNYINLKRALTPLPLPTPEQLKTNVEIRDRMIGMFQMMKAEARALKAEHPPRLIPGTALDEKDGRPLEGIDWRLVPEASLDNFIRTLDPQNEADRALQAYQTILNAYADNNPSEFNTAIGRYRSILDRMRPPEYYPGTIELETDFNQFSPFYVGLILYVVAFLVSMIGWLIPSRTMTWTAFSLVTLTFILHTTALVMRIYISGRPPVTNLYSSAIFIGWACVLFGLVAELIFRIGLGNVVASFCGFATLIIAYFLGIDGDTIGVMQAVLDTQFWLATHVVCITCGYGATYFAGMMGVTYVLAGVCTPRLEQDHRKILARMIYGTTCFAIFFSFFGTVLGGLWADDSWGRFWGWDPKENGALMIVLWNALVLHARWDKLVGDRGLALLSIGGNIVTTWSWFNVNGLGVGLHAYGQKFGVNEITAAFDLFCLLVVLIGLIPLKHWWSVRNDSSGISKAVT